MITDAAVRALAERLVEVPGVEAVALGGSRARGEARPDSDVDLGLYYRRPLDTAGLRRLARSVAEAREDGDEPPALTEPGGWGPWVDGGGWLTIAGTPVDWIYRDLDRVHRSVAQARAGELDFSAQVGHPFGVPTVLYAGEVALGVVLADPGGELRRLRDALADYPPALAEAMVDRLGEARFLLGVVAKAARRGDTAYVAGCLFRVVVLCAYAIHGRAGRWLVNEKGAVDAAARLDPAPAGFAERAHGVLAGLGRRDGDLHAAVRRAADLVDDVARACAGP